MNAPELADVIIGANLDDDDAVMILEADALTYARAILARFDVTPRTIHADR